MAKSTNMDVIGERIITMLSRKNEARERGLPLSREAIRHCANAIRAIHRAEFDRAEQLLEAAHIRIEEMKKALAQHPDLRYGGFVFDAEKEYSEAHATLALVRGEPLPDPDDLGVDYVAYVNGLGEAIGEMRRHLLDELRRGDPVRIEDLLSAVDDIYNLLISVDFPDAITAGLRRTTDIARGVLEKTRGDLTLTFQQRSLERRLREIEARLISIALPSATVSAEAKAESREPVRRRRSTAPEPEAIAPQAAPAPPAPAPPPPTAEAEAPERRPQRRRRKAPSPAAEAIAPSAEAPEPAPPAPVTEAAGEVAPKRRRRRRRHPATASALPEVATQVEAPTAGVAAPPPPLPEVAVPPVAVPEAAPVTPETGEAAPRRWHHRRRRPRAGASPAPAEAVAAPPGPAPEAEQASLAASSVPVGEAAPLRRRRRRRRRAATPVEGVAPPLAAPSLPPTA